MPKLTLQQIVDATPAIRELQFGAADGSALPDYTPGAHLDFDLGAAGTRSYSLIDWPGDRDLATYRIAVQKEDAGQGGSLAMHALQVGDQVSATSPSNDFELIPGETPVLLLAGGIGVTPLISMATALLAQGRKFAFHYAGRSEAVMGFTESLCSHFQNHLSLHFDDVEPLDLTSLMADQPEGIQLYICGPKGMIDAARASAEAAGISDIHVELFSTPEPAGDETSFEVEIHDTGQVFTIPADKTIIEVLEEAGVDIMYDCQRGDCGICQTDVISGEPDHRDVVLTDAERESGKIMQICVSRARSARLVLDL
ncbi:MAG: PDR/VanB family oxidoreductase [Alphaproteobacteria bacterium]|nr:PDR/VanB family oxidoreductase [Alphaproteobacteria bacterium]